MPVGRAAWLNSVVVAVVFAIRGGIVRIGEVGPIPTE
jgi:hypothetical protein